MGSNSSRPAFPMPLEPYDPDRSRMAPMLGKWTLSSMAKKSKKGKDRGKYDDFIVPKYPNYPMPYYPQVQSGYPAYYAPVPMAVVPPYGAQQPVLAMPQAYFPMVAYQTNAAHAQPPVIPGVTVRPITAMQMPALAAAPAPAPAPAAQMPVPAPAPVPQPTPAPPPSAPSHMPEPHPISGTTWADQPRAPPAPTQMPQPHPSATTTQMPQAYPPSNSIRDRDEGYRMPQSHPSSVPTQMPQPHPVHDQGPAIPIPPSPVPADPVTPPHPMVGSEPRRSASVSSRPRFTDFYRAADFPSPHRADADEPVRPPTVGPAGRTPFAPPASMPTPAPAPTLRMPTPTSTIPISNNPLPPLPADIWDTLPYRQVLENLPTDVSTLLDLGQRSEIFVGPPDDPIPRPSSRLGALFGSSSRKDKGKGPLRGLFRSRSTSGQDVLRDVLPDAGPSSGSRHGHGRTQTMTAIVIPPPGPSTSTMEMPVPTSGPPIKFDHTGKFSGFVNHSNHRVMYKNKMYPTALHLLEAMKFTHQPALQERIRTCKDVNDMYPLSASFQESVRRDWGQVFLKTMDDVLLLKFKQHPNLRSLLLGTGLASIVYADDNEYWGEGATGEGTNELGRALVRVRERLRQEVDE